MKLRYTKLVGVGHTELTGEIDDLGAMGYDQAVQEGEGRVALKTAETGTEHYFEVLNEDGTAAVPTK